MTPHFLGRVDVHQWRDWWVLDAPLTFVHPLFALTVPASFITDFASIPVGLRNLFSPTDARWTAAALLHDRLYELGAHAASRGLADLLFLDAMAVDPQPTGVHPACWATRRAIYRGVRLGGGRAYATGAERGAERRALYEVFWPGVQGTA